MSVFHAGGLGQLGQQLATSLRDKYGRDNVLLTDIKKPDYEVTDDGRLSRFYLTLSNLGFISATDIVDRHFYHFCLIST